MLVQMKAWKTLISGSIIKNKDHAVFAANIILILKKPFMKINSGDVLFTAIPYE